MEYRATAQIDADAARVWATLENVEDWPSWTPTMESVRITDGGPLREGTQVEVRQPRLGRNTWHVTRVIAGRRFEWATRSPGLRLRADHLLTPLDGRRCTVELEIEVSGWLTGLVLAAYGRRIRGYLELEAASLKDHCEKRTSPS